MNFKQWYKEVFTPIMDKLPKINIEVEKEEDIVPFQKRIMFLLEEAYKAGYKEGR